MRATSKTNVYLAPPPCPAHLLIGPRNEGKLSSTEVAHIAGVKVQAMIFANLGMVCVVCV